MGELPIIPAAYCTNDAATRGENPSFLRNTPSIPTINHVHPPGRLREGGRNCFCRGSLPLRGAARWRERGRSCFWTYSGELPLRAAARLSEGGRVGAVCDGGAPAALGCSME